MAELVPGKTRESPPGALERQLAAQAMQRDVVPKAREAAEKWGAAIALVLGGAGLAALLEGPKKFEALTPCWEAAGKGLFFLGAAVGLWAALMAALTSQISFKSMLVGGAAARRREKDVRDTVLWRLNASRWATVIALALLLASVACIWFGTKDDEKLLVQGIASGGEFVCGEPTRSKARVVIRGVSGVSFELTALRSVEAVERCPRTP
jgi:hypothetical protein